MDFEFLIILGLLSLDVSDFMLHILKVTLDSFDHLLRVALQDLQSSRVRLAVNFHGLHQVTNALRLFTDDSLEFKANVV